MERKQRLLLMKPAAVVASVGLCLALSGCYGVYEGKAEKNLKQAADWNAQTFPESKDLYEQAQKSLDSAKSASSGGQGKEARTQAKEAAKLSEQAVAAAKTKFADLQLKTAESAMKVATINEGKEQNPKLYTQADEARAESRVKYDKQKYEDSINLSKQVIGDVDQLLASLRNTAENRLSELRTKLGLLKAAKAAEFNPQPILRAEESSGTIEKKIAEERDYKQAIILAGSAISDIDAAIIETKKRNSADQLEKLEDKIAEAIAEEAPIHVPDTLKNIQDSFEGILAGFYEKQYDSVLNASEALIPRVNELITMSRIEATKDRIRLVNEGITRLKEQSVEQYLPGRIKVMEDLLVKANEEFNNNKFENAKFEAGNALIEQDRIISSFDSLAESTIQNATASFDAAKRTYERMGQIFSSTTTPVDNRLEARFRISSTELSSRLSSSRDALAFASSSRTGKEFKKAIESAKDANATADAVSNGTYKLVSENALLGIQDQISMLERQGARDFAGKQLAEVQTLVEQTQKLIAENQNREAAESAARTRAYLENVKQELARQARNEAGRTDDVIRRLEGGAAPTPASGGGSRGLQNGAPGGSDSNNKDAMLGNDVSYLISARDAITLSSPEPVLLAQTKVGNPVNSSAYTGNQGYLDNRNINAGTFMTQQPPSSVFLRTSAPTGAVVGTRAEPVVPTTEDTGSYVGGSEGSYESPTGPGPFVAMAAVEGGTAPGVSLNPAAPPASVAGIREQIDSILLDDQRARDIQEFQPRAIEAAKEKLSESSSALASQDYVRAMDLAREAQRIIIEADRKAAKAAAERNIQDAADRINLAEAAGSIMFAPAELNEAIHLYEQARTFLATGDYTQARSVSAKAVIAADDARLYNVNKARDMTALSTRYGGYKASAPAMTEASRASQFAEELLNNPATAAQGQEVAKQAVALSQVALDSARDFTFQERLDNIYKALNTALRAGANYFNVTEIKRLMAELTVAREEYCTRNFDAVELKLKDIEARLARVIETTPLVLEENLIQTTEKLNALVLAGAENWMAQEVDDVKSLMNRSVIDFRKHDYYSSYTNIRNAMQLTDRIEARLQEQVYYDSVTELFAQLDAAFLDFSGILNFDRAFVKKLVATPQGQPAAISYSGRMSPNAFKDRITDIYLRAIHLKPPQSQEGTHNEVLTAIKFAKVAAENFQKLYILDQVSMPDAYDIIDTAFNQYQRSRILRGEIQVRLIEPQARTKVIRAEKIVNF